jgi:hypothetical protein
MSTTHVITSVNKGGTLLLAGLKYVDNDDEELGLKYEDYGIEDYKPETDFGEMCRRIH